MRLAADAGKRSVDVCAGRCAAALLLGLAGTAQASVVTYDFESFADLDPLTTQLSGLSFSHATVIGFSGSSGGSLNNLEFPPHSGNNVVLDDGGAISIDFSGPGVFGVGGYFTYVSGLSFDVFSGSTLLAHLAGAFSSNIVSSGHAPNELLQFSTAAGNITRLVITGSPSGASLVLDDLRVDFGDRQTVPEPQILALVATLLAGGCLPGGWLRRHRGRP